MITTKLFGASVKNLAMDFLGGLEITQVGMGDAKVVQ